MKLFRILENGYFGGMSEVPDEIGFPPGNTTVETPDIPEGMFAKWTGYNWELTDVAPSVEQPQEELMIDQTL